MITKLSHTLIYVLDQDSAKKFYTDKLGCTVHSDVVMGEGFEGSGAGFRWLTVSPPGASGIEIILADPAMGHDEQTARQIRELVAKGAIGPGVWGTDDCRKTFQELSDQGVVFLHDPVERHYGVEASFRDDSGNWFSLTEHQPEG